MNKNNWSLKQLWTTVRAAICYESHEEHHNVKSSSNEHNFRMMSLSTYRYCCRPGRLSLYCGQWQLIIWRLFNRISSAFNYAQHRIIIKRALFTRATYTTFDHQLPNDENAEVIGTSMHSQQWRCNYKLDLSRSAFFNVCIILFKWYTSQSRLLSVTIHVFKRSHFKHHIRITINVNYTVQK